MDVWRILKINSNNNQINNKKMTANQFYKLSGSSAPFSDWVGEQKKKYGEKFVENEEFINMNGEGFYGQSQATPEEVVMQNADENISYPRGAAIGGTVTIGGSELTAKAGVSNATRLIYIVGGVVVAYYLYKNFIKK